MSNLHPEILFVVEGFTDIRFVTALSEVCQLTMVVPKAQYYSSGLQERLVESGAGVQVEELNGGRLAYQLACSRYLWKHATRFDGIITQELLRGSLSACLVGAMRRVPVAAYMCLPPREYFRCRRFRREIGWLAGFAGENIIRVLMSVNGRLCSRCVTLGPYLETVARPYCSRLQTGYYYGVDTNLYVAVEKQERDRIRARLGLPLDSFIIFLSSRISHEKDPETVLRAASAARAEGLNALVLNLSGGYQDFLALANSLNLPNAEKWVVARPPAHPMRELVDYYQAADCVAQASLAEGLGMSPLEALACGVPAICTAVGGLAANLRGFGRLVPIRDHVAMKEEFLWVSHNPEEARREALRGREFVLANWSRDRARQALRDVVCQLAAESGKSAERKVFATPIVRRDGDR